MYVQIQPSAVITWVNIVRYYTNTGIVAEYQSLAASTKDTPYFTITGKLWGIFCEYLWENWLRYNGTALYIYIDGLAQDNGTSSGLA